MGLDLGKAAIALRHPHIVPVRSLGLPPVRELELRR